VHGGPHRVSPAPTRPDALGVPPGARLHPDLRPPPSPRRVSARRARRSAPWGGPGVGCRGPRRRPVAWRAAPPAGHRWRRRVPDAPRPCRARPAGGVTLGRVPCPRGHAGCTRLPPGVWRARQRRPEGARAALVAMPGGRRGARCAGLGPRASGLGPGAAACGARADPGGARAAGGPASRGPPTGGSHRAGTPRPPGARSPSGPAGWAGGRGWGRRTRPAPCGVPPGPTPHLRRRALRGDPRHHKIRWNVEIDIEAVFSLVEEHPPPRYLVIFYVPEMYMAPLHRCPIRLMIIGPVHKSSIVDPIS
jgi:hypothetical protein